MHINIMLNPVEVKYSLALDVRMRHRNVVIVYLWDLLETTNECRPTSFRLASVVKRRSPLVQDPRAVAIVAPTTWLV